MIILLPFAFAEAHHVAANGCISARLKKQGDASTTPDLEAYPRFLNKEEIDVL